MSEKRRNPPADLEIPLAFLSQALRCHLFDYWFLGCIRVFCACIGLFFFFFPSYPFILASMLSVHVFSVFCSLSSTFCSRFSAFSVFLCSLYSIGEVEYSRSAELPNKTQKLESQVQNVAKTTLLTETTLLRLSRGGNFLTLGWDEPKEGSRTKIAYCGVHK